MTFKENNEKRGLESGKGVCSFLSSELTFFLLEGLDGGNGVAELQLSEHVVDGLLFLKGLGGKHEELFKEKEVHFLVLLAISKKEGQRVVHFQFSVAAKVAALPVIDPLLQF